MTLEFCSNHPKEASPSVFFALAKDKQLKLIDGMYETWKAIDTELKQNESWKAIDTELKQNESTADPSTSVGNKFPESPDDDTISSSNKFEWQDAAREYGKEFIKDYPSLSLAKIAEKVHQVMVDEGITGRGDRVPVAETIRRQALTGIKG